MSDETKNLPAQREERPGFSGSPDLLPARREPAQIARSMTDVDSWTGVIQNIVTLSEHVAHTSFVPKGLRGDAPAVAAALLFGRELGLGPMMSLQNVQVVEGTPGLKAEHLRAMVLAAGHSLEYAELSGDRVIAVGRRRGQSRELRVEWNIDMARAAGLLGKNNWKHYPRAMLTARATAELCRLQFADVTHGLYATEELEDGVVAELERANEPGSESRPATSGAGGTRKVTRKRTAAAAPSAQPVTDPAGGGGQSDAGASGEAVPPPPVSEAPVAPPEAAAPPPPPQQASDHAVRRCDMLGAHEQHTWDSFTGEGGPFMCPGYGAASAPPPQQSPADERAYAATQEDVEAEADSLMPPGVEPEDRVRMADPQQVRLLNIRLTELEIKDREQKLNAISALVGRTVASSKELTSEECDDLIDALRPVESRVQLIAMVNDAIRSIRSSTKAAGDGDPA